MSYRSNPYIVGSVVTGKDFYGRNTLLDKIFWQNRPIVHLLGLRRIGKTSLLKALAARGKALDFNLQRIHGWAEFHRVLSRRFKKRQQKREPLLPWLKNLEPILKSEDVFEFLEILDDELDEAGDRLWLLLDEAECLINLGRQDVRALQKFRSVIGELQAIQIVFASAKQLTELDELTSNVWHGSPFLNHFPPPLYIGGLEDEAGLALIRQTQNHTPLPVSTELCQAICHRTNYHPYFIQRLCYKLWERSSEAEAWKVGDLDFSITSRLKSILKSDFDYLSHPERQIMQAVLRQYRLPDIHPAYVQGLVKFGYLRSDETDYEIGNEFFRNYLFGLENAAWTMPSKTSAGSTQRLYEKSETPIKEMTMSDPYSITWALMVMEKTTEFLFGQAGEMLKEWRERRKQTESASPQPETAITDQINDPQTLKSTVKVRLETLNEQSQQAASRMKVQEIDSLLKQIEDLHRNKLMYAEEATKLPSLDDRLAIRRRIEDIDNQMAQKTASMRQVLEELIGQKIQVPALDKQ